MMNTRNPKPLWRRTSRWATPFAALALSLFAFGPQAQAQFPESFTGATFPPTGWTTFETGPDASQQWVRITSPTNSAPGAAQIRYSVAGATNVDYLVTPQFTPGAGDELSFWEREAFSPDYGSTFSVMVSTTTPDVAGFSTTLWTRGETPTFTSFTLRSVSLAAYVGTPIYIAFVNSNDDGDSWRVDDVDVSAAPFCGDLICNGAETFATCPGDCPPVPGSCDAPVALTSGVPLFSETSCGSGVQLPDNACSTTYDSDAPAEAMVYSYTTGGTAEDITVSMTSVVGTYSGLSMISGTCNDPGATCLGFVGNSGTGPRTFTAVGVPASTTVHVYVTTWPTPNCVTSYDLLLTATPLLCSAPTASTSMEIADCGAGTYTVEVTVTGTGDGATVNLVSDLLGTEYAAVDGTNMGGNPYVMGPYTMDSPATLTMEHELDDACDVALGTFNYLSANCPTIVTCGSTTNETYCYVDNDLQEWNYAASAAFPLALSFIRTPSIKP